ncbi:PKD domain-containing protein [Pedobacter sp. SYSU D00535]|uniref:PKD domain-containing protein n=1 Tax=Pedobacter sp. SYSU D00535 TaxID=2810308 RepID=UPI001A9710BD|nr:PKD domain-containing protein [Pedobacter sp. SYSU D00535]
MIRVFTVFSFLVFFFTSTSYGQHITIGTIDAGPYGQNATIAVPLHVEDPGGKLQVDNIFRLYISDATGSFASEKEIGSYNGFYTTFINGTIPAGLPAGSYKFRVKSTSGAAESNISNAITVQASTGLQASIDAPLTQTLSNNPKTFGNCEGAEFSAFNFRNTSSAGATVSARFTNEFNAADVKSISFSEGTKTFYADVTHYTIFVKAELGGTIATKAYFLINNTVNTAFSTSGTNTVCLPAGVLEYGVETSSASGIQNNFPGNTYQINWGDDAVDVYTLNQIKANGSKVKHTYYKSSCGKKITIDNATYYNVFGIIIQAKSPYCSSIGVPISSQAKVVTQPENRFETPKYACLNTPLTINNSSLSGENPSATTPECQNNNVVYFWYVDDVLVTPDGVPLSYQLKHTFTTAGEHRIRLESKSNSRCQAPPVERKIWIQNPPKPDFKLSEELVCLNSTIKVTDLSVVDNTGDAPNDYLWTISGPAAPAFTNGTTATSKEPQFVVGKAGVYTIKLTITSSCKPVVSKEVTFVVNEKPVITATWQANLCGKGQLLTFNNSGGNPVPTEITGTFKEETASYTWKISGGSYALKNGTSLNSKEPAILFNDYGTYTIEVTATNNCGSTSFTKQITFNESPTVSAGEDQVICADETVSLTGVLSGPPVSSYIWKGGKGTFSPGRNSLNPVYTPSADEIKAGKVELILAAVTSNPAPCDKVEDVVVITINPTNKITTAAAKEICTGTSVDYNPEAVIKNSEIRWTAVGTANASGYKSSGTGKIEDILTNTSNDATATVTYTITPRANGCDGESFTFTVSVSPVPTVSATAKNAIVCTKTSSGIELSAPFAGTLYTWTSSVTGDITGHSQQATPASLAAINDMLVNAGNTQGTATYVITPVTAAGCAGTPVTVTVTVTAAPVIANAGADQKLCSVTTTKLDGNFAGSGAGKWELLSGQAGVTFDDASKADATVFGLKQGQTYNFKWTISGPGTCSSSEDIVTVSNLNPISNNSIVYKGFTVCEGASVTVEGTEPTGGDGSYAYLWEVSKDQVTWSPVNVQNEKNLTVTLTETTFFRRKATSGDCNSESSVVRVEVQKGITNNTISSNQSICSETLPSRLEGSVPEGADGSYKYQWQISTDNKNWSNLISATQASYQPAVLSQTTYFRRLVASTVCTGALQSVSNVVEVKVSKGAVANFNWSSEASCAPFQITADNIKAERSEEGDRYEWFANNISIGKRFEFPGYLLKNAGDVVEIRLEVTSALGCGTRTFSHLFKTKNSITASFTANKIQGCGPLVVNFTNKTANPEGVNFEWHFGNGQKSNLPTPPPITFDARTDNKDTVYVVILKATSSCATSSDTMNIKVVAPPRPRFSPSTVTGCSPLTVTFRNLSPGSSNTYIWNFGDGKTDTTYDNRSVEHTFRTSKTKSFSVTLTVKNDCGVQTSLPIKIEVAPNTVNPDLVVSSDQLAGCAPHTVRFFNNTVGAVTYTYDFGDGTEPLTTTSDEPIEHVFKKGGVYNVRLTASNCSDTVVTKKITVYQQAETGFAADVTEGCAPLKVRFTNTTKNAVSYEWDFGDGSTYKGQNPPDHVYNGKQQSYTVRLITKSTYGCMDTLVMKDFVKVFITPTASFKPEPGNEIQHPNYRFSFKNTSKGDVAKISWDFGDGSPLSSISDPQHSYADTGVYRVRLTVSNAIGCSSVAEQIVRITGVPGALFIPNAFMPNSASEELRSFRAKGSGIDKWHFRIFNKWGELIWQTDKLDPQGAPAEAWDGTFNGVPAPQGIYFWEVAAKFKNGTEWAGMPYNNSEPKKTGDLHLIR